jgi:hypothetical protein
MTWQPDAQRDLRLDVRDVLPDSSLLRQLGSDAICQRYLDLHTC